MFLSVVLSACSVSLVSIACVAMLQAPLRALERATRPAPPEVRHAR